MEEVLEIGGQPAHHTLQILLAQHSLSLRQSEGSRCLPEEGGRGGRGPKGERGRGQSGGGAGGPFDGRVGARDGGVRGSSRGAQRESVGPLLGGSDVVELLPADVHRGPAPL